jgi:hypothetical protein
MIGGQHFHIKAAGCKFLNGLSGAGNAGGPLTSRYGPDWSLMTPIRITGRV